MSGVVGEIAASAVEQASGLDKVTSAVNQIGRITQQNAAQAEESTAASYQLAEEAQQLVEMVARFKIADHQARGPVEGSVARGVNLERGALLPPPPAPATPPSAPPPRSPRAVVNSVSSSNAAADQLEAERQAGGREAGRHGDARKAGTC